MLEVACLLKSYAAPVLDCFDFDLERGEVHALVGANGAGKSTFARILCGLTAADGGAIRLAGRDHAPRSKSEGEAAGVVMVPQERGLIASLSVAENLFLDRLPHRCGFVDRRRLDLLARRALDRVGLEALPPETPAGALGVGRQQLVEIAGALARDCRVLILDEPTAATTDHEVGRLFAEIERLRREGVGILYISHRLDEIRRIADRVTVMRDGRRVSVHAVADVDPRQLVREMSGHDLEEQVKTSPTLRGEPVLRVDRLCAGDRVRDVSFALHRGEILGLAGLVGSGRTETVRAIFGADRASSGSVSVGDGPPRRFDAPALAVAAGLGLVPEDREQDGLLRSQPVRVNTTLATLSRHSRRGWLNRDSEAAATRAVCDRLAVRCASIEQPVVELSGGNQQKITIGRWLDRGSEVLLCDEPTRGVDAAAKDTIHHRLRELAQEGRGVVVVSSELTELMDLCHRILVLSVGRVAGEFTAGHWTQEDINAAAFSGHRDGAVERAESP